MKRLLSVYLVALFVATTLSAEWFTQKEEIRLKKDEQKKILVKYDDKKKLFVFRWTLYKNGGLVMFRVYDKIVAQNVLYLRYQNESFRFDLKNRSLDAYEVPYILVKFKEFDDVKKEAVFDLFLFDKKKQVELEFLKNELKRDNAKS
ncbi:hypothetical protein [Sulfurimonas sp.]|uniref:hypothetical protein n=1 Tax=Sulfurimonas sp. TaxID=2022749 RepID=UPI0025FFBC20|nr:hypothetical protein [Sulfurimonas sp.]MDD5156775.1 hypothetical protein [Sulfurimonas sp.]